MDFSACPADLLQRADIRIEELSKNVRRGSLEERSRGLQLSQLTASDNEEIEAARRWL